MTHQQDWALRALQEFHCKLYGISDDRRYDVTDIISYIHRHVTKILKNVRKDDHGHTKYHLCSAFSWTIGYVNRMHIDLVEEMWKRFPNKCPYCAQKPCACKQRGKTRQNLANSNSPIVSLGDWQNTIADIFPTNTLLGSAMHLAEEIGELQEASRNYRHGSSEERFQKVIEEIIDVFANLMAVSTCLNLSLGEALARYFSKLLCPKCKKSPCVCEYVEFDDPIEF